MPQLHSVTSATAAISYMLRLHNHRTPLLQYISDTSPGTRLKDETQARDLTPSAGCWLPPIIRRQRRTWATNMWLGAPVAGQLGCSPRKATPSGQHVRVRVQMPTLRLVYGRPWLGTSRWAGVCITSLQYVPEFQSQLSTPVEQVLQMSVLLSLCLPPSHPHPPRLTGKPSACSTELSPAMRAPLLCAIP